MTIEEIKLRRLAGQHLLAPAPPLTVAEDLCGLQAQFLSAACHALRIRSTEDSLAGLVKSWTLRGTVHLFPETDLPLYIRRRGVPEDVTASAWYRWLCDHGYPLTEERARFFAVLMAEAIARGSDTREGLRLMCRERGMTETEEAHVFHSWCGSIAQLAELGVICSKVQEKKAYRLCPDFTPLTAEAAETELARRYFTHYGPATLRDAAYFFHCPQTKVKTWLARLPARSVAVEGRTYFDLPGPEPEGDVPPVLFLGGFDQLMLGYHKEDNPFLPQEYLRGIFNLAGIVAPAVLLHGRVAGRWKRQGEKLTITIFETVSPEDRKRMEAEAVRLWPEAAIGFEHA